MVDSLVVFILSKIGGLVSYCVLVVLLLEFLFDLSIAGIEIFIYVNIFEVGGIELFLEILLFSKGSLLLVGKHSLLVVVQIGYDPVVTLCLGLLG